VLNVPEFCGIGARLNVNNGILTVTSVIEGASAFKAGLKTGDKIIEIDGDLTINMSLQEAVSRLKGNPSTTVLLTIEEAESKTRKKVTLERRIITKSYDYSKFIVSDTKGNELKSPRFLIEEYDIFYAPSASVLKFVLEKRKKRKEVSGKVLAFGNPELEDESINLPHAEEEVRKIKESYPETSIYVKDKATEVKAKQLSGNYDIIHFASHGELNPQSPLFSCIKMAKEKDEDGRLEVHEIFNLDLENASLVTLSACETGLGKLSKGDELIGLTRGFVYAGTPSIVASLWEVNDKSTSDLMSLFYKNLKTHSKVEALRMAQLEMINGEVGRGIVRGVGGITTSNEGEDNPQTSITVNGSHPYFWAPFILLGDWN
jgi:CHAT domain-containing protein